MRVMIATILLYVLAGLGPSFASGFLTDEVNNFIVGKVNNKESAFISSCNVNMKSKKYVTSIIIFPKSNSGMFVFGRSNQSVSNEGSIRLDQDGQWDLAELEGGTQTIRIMSDLFFELSRQPFTWSAPLDVRRTWNRAPHIACEAPPMGRQTSATPTTRSEDSPHARWPARGPSPSAMTPLAG